MNPKTLLVALAVLAVAVGFAIRATSEKANATTTLNALASQRDEWQRKIVVLEGRRSTAINAIAEMEKSDARFAVNRGASGSSAAAADGQLSDKSTPVVRKLSPASLVANDPKKMAEYAKNYRESLDLTLGGMFRKLGLSPEQIEKVKDLRVWHEQSRIDLEAVAEAQGLNMQGDAYMKVRWGDLANERRKKEAEIFDSGELLERYRNYSRLWYVRDTVQRIASSEMGSDTPATFAQVERATDVVAANGQLRDPTNPEKSRWQAGGWSWQDWVAINWTVAEPQLQGVLSPAQYFMLRQFLRTQEAWNAVAARNSANQQEARRLVRPPGG